VFFASVCVEAARRKASTRLKRLVSSASHVKIQSYWAASIPTFRARAAPPLFCRMTRRLMCSRAKRACHRRAFTDVSSLEPSSTTTTSIGRSVRWARSDARHASIVVDALNAGTTQVTPLTVVSSSAAMRSAGATGAGALSAAF
jgi:hypothetical protein